jgi:rhodanese-related sulfurtransferase
MGFGQVFQRALVIVCVGTLAGVVHSARSERGRTASRVQSEAGFQVPGGDGRVAHGQENEIDLARAWELYQQGTPFIDARYLEEYEQGHVQGAFWIAASLFMNGGRPSAMDYLDPTMPVVIYCSGGRCDASHNVAEFLTLAGFQKCLIMKDGYGAWAAAGHPTETGKPEGGP